MVSRALVATIVLALFGGVLVSVYTPNLGLLSRSPQQSGIGCNRPAGYILILADQNGFNNSVNHKRPWPVLTVQKGSTVNLIVCNTDTVEAHGFGIDTYVSPTQLRPGQFFRTSFIAEQGGNFTIYCSIFCSVHVFMQGRLAVV